MKIKAFDGELPALKSLESGLLALDAPRGLAPDFTIYTSAMTTSADEPGIVRMVGSSTEKDMQGDTMTLQALSDMAQAPARLTIWLNHDYSLPGSIFGSLVEPPKLIQQGGVTDLHIASDVEKENPAALQTYKYIQNGRRIGCSVGAMVLEYEIDDGAFDGDDDSEWGNMRGIFGMLPIQITRLLPLEWSVCGIPANQRCWTESALKGVFARTWDRRLASAVKGLYPRQYADLVAACPSATLRRDLERVAARPTHAARAEWVPLTKSFVINRRGRLEGVEPERVGGVIEDYIASGPRRVAAVGPEDDLPDFTADAEPELTKGACGKTTWPLADRDTAWDSGAAHKRIQDWAGGDNPDWSKVASVCMWKADAASTWGDFKLPFCDVIGGSVKAVPRAIFAIAGVMQGARGGAQIDDEAGVKSRVETYYARMRSQFGDDGIQPPWADDGGDKATEPEKVDSATVGLLCEIQSGMLAQYNLLGGALGLPPVARDAETGKLLYSAGAEPPIEAFARVVEGVLAIQRAGAEFSKENQGHLVALHATLRAMTDDKICAMDGKKKPPAADDDGDDDGDGGPPQAQPMNRAFLRALAVQLDESVREAVAKQIGALTTALDGLNVKALAASVAVAQNSLLNLRREISEVREEAASAASAASQLLNMPLGQPTRFVGRQVTALGAVSAADFLAVSGQTPGTRWQGTLEQAVKACRYEDLEVGDGFTAKYRVWPAGIGGSVKEGVRPALSGQQKSLMRPEWILAYQEGGEARVPLLDLAAANMAQG